MLEVTVSDGKGGSHAQALSITITDDPLIRLQVRALLQGAYHNQSGLMANSLHSLGLLPLLQPYAEDPIRYTGTETATPVIMTANGNDAVVDWMLIELRDASAPATLVKTVAVMVQRDGDLVDVQTGSPIIEISNTQAQSYYVRVHHRNHLGIMTAAPMQLNDTPTPIDFTQTTTATYGNHARLAVGNIALMWAGDANQNQQVIAIGPNNDASTVLEGVLTDAANAQFNTNYALTGYHNADLNMDGKALYAGPDNDINLLLGNALIHPGNNSFAANFIVGGTLPK